MSELTRACQILQRGGGLDELCEERLDVPEIQRKCKICGEAGHFSRECPNRRQRREGLDPKLLSLPPPWESIKVP